MKVFKILAAGYMIGAVVNKDGQLSSDGALDLWNENAGPSYQGDTAETVKFFEG